MLGAIWITSKSTADNKPDHTFFTLNEVESKYVCMINNKLFDQVQIPVEVEGRTYYGCCEMCKGRLANDPQSRMAIDPLSENAVDKALSVTAANPDGDVYYFENEKNLQRFNTITRGQN